MAADIQTHHHGADGNDHAPHPLYGPGTATVILAVTALILLLAT